MSETTTPYDVLNDGLDEDADETYVDVLDTDLQQWAVYSSPQRRLLIWTSRESEAKSKRDFCRLMGAPWERLAARGHTMMRYEMTYCEYESVPGERLN